MHSVFCFLSHFLLLEDLAIILSQRYAFIIYDKAAVLNQPREFGAFRVVHFQSLRWPVQLDGPLAGKHPACLHLALQSPGTPPVMLTCWHPPILQSGCKVLPFISLSSLISPGMLNLFSWCLCMIDEITESKHGFRDKKKNMMLHLNEWFKKPLEVDDYKQRRKLEWSLW